MPEPWYNRLTPIPIFQWLVVGILIAHLLLSDHVTFGTEHLLHILLLLGCNLTFLYGLPRYVSMATVATMLVIADTILIPTTLYVTGTTETDLLVAFLGVAMIAAASGDLKRALLLASIPGGVYVGFTLLTMPEEMPLGLVLVRFPFLLAMTLMYGAVVEYAGQVQFAKDRLAHAAMHDELTGLPNRRHLLDTLSRQLQEAKRFGTPLSCIVTDLDRFKEINDKYGHAMGDLVLCEFTSVLAVQSRSYDMIGRMGGDEFVWLLSRVDTEGAIAAAERFREAIQRFQFGGESLTCSATTSIGLTTYLPQQMGTITPDEMLRAADVGLYRAKHQGRNRTNFQPLKDDWVDSHRPTDSKTVTIETA